MMILKPSATHNQWLCPKMHTRWIPDRPFVYIGLREFERMWMMTRNIWCSSMNWRALRKWKWWKVNPRSHRSCDDEEDNQYWFYFEFGSNLGHSFVRSTFELVGSLHNCDEEFSVVLYLQPLTCRTMLERWASWWRTLIGTLLILSVTFYIVPGEENLAQTSDGSLCFRGLYISTAHYNSHFRKKFMWLIFATFPVMFLTLILSCGGKYFSDWHQDNYFISSCRVTTSWIEKQTPVRSRKWTIRKPWNTCN